MHADDDHRGHGHDGADHTHEELDHPGHFHARDKPHREDFTGRAFTIGIGLTFCHLRS